MALIIMDDHGPFHQTEPVRKLDEHKDDAGNELIGVFVMDQPGCGGAHYVYDVLAPLNDTLRIEFQCGPIGEVGHNGITEEVLLAILLDRLRCFQNGPFACRENELALEGLEEALRWLHARTRDRLSREVEGTSQP